MLSKLLKELFAELYFKTKSFIFIVHTHFCGDIVFIIEKKRLVDKSPF